MRVHVRVTPRSAAEAIRLEPDGSLAVRVTAPPADGAANAAVTKLLAKALNLPQRDIVLVSGASSRNKVFELPLEEAQLMALLARSPKKR